MIEFQHILCIAITSRMYSVNCSLFTKLFKHLLNLVNMLTDNRNLNFKCMNNYKILLKKKEHECHPNGYVFGIICSYSVMSYIFISIKKKNTIVLATRARFTPQIYVQIDSTAFFCVL